MRYRYVCQTALLILFRDFQYELDDALWRGYQKLRKFPELEELRSTECKLNVYKTQGEILLAMKDRILQFSPTIKGKK